ncbi:piRNA biogenesis protein EXD1-like [Oscarella lobularis]|uniref:piRNA biogenesis protein EXD1-like n=1 Tax=Oscarella lobularis TaxID=121494 RepID=UPI003313FA4B
MDRVGDGDFVRVRVLDGTYEGAVLSCHRPTQQLTMQRVKDVETGRMHARMTFHWTEITKIEVLERANKEMPCATKETSSKEGVPVAASPVKTPPSKQASHSRRRSGGATTTTGSVHYDLVKTKEKFEKMVACVRQFKIIGLGLEGINLGKAGMVTIIQISCSVQTYIVDFQAIGRYCFEHAAFVDMLQSDQYLKVIHDSRNVSAALFNFKIRLENVFDTQVADFVIRRNTHKKVPRFISGLGDCLMRYLKMTEEQVDFHKYAHQCLKSNFKVWSIRPISVELLDAAAKDVLYLPALHQAMMKAHFSDFTRGFQVYLEAGRSVSRPKCSSGVMPQLKDLYSFECCCEQKDC